MMLFAFILSLSSALSAPQLAIDNPTVDIGLHPYYRELSHVFTLKNRGDRPLRAAVRKVTCGCTSHTLSGDTIPPGGTAQLELGYKPKEKDAKSGSQTFSIELETNDPAQPFPILKLNLELVDHVHVTPAQLSLAVDSVGGNNVQTLDIFCMNDGTEPEIVHVESPGPAVSVEPVETTTRDGVTVHRYRVARASDTGGDVNGPIVVRTTSPRVPIIEVPVTSGAPERVRAIPTRVLFGVVRGSTTVEKQVVLGAEEAGIVPHGCESSDPRVAAELSGSGPSGQFVLRVKLTPRAVERVAALRAEVNVLDKAGTRLCRLPVIATLAP